MSERPAPSPAAGGARTEALMQIGEVAEQIGLSLRTIRHYEEVGLVVPTARSQGGFRLYSPADVDRLRLIMRMKPLGFTLEEMRELIAVLDDLARPMTRQKDHELLLDQLTTFQQAAASRVVALREQLGTAEGFAALLDATATRYRQA